MERNECERMLEQKFRELIGIYHQYNPNGKYLSATFMDDDGDGWVRINNRNWHFDDESGTEDGEDVNSPIDIDQKAPLTIETKPNSYSTVQKIVTGFSKDEFDEIAELYDSGEKQEAEDRALEIIDSRNGNIGSCWHNGYGIYGFRVGTKGCTFIIGNTCD